MVEEHWSSPLAGTMVGMFRWVEKGRVRFYELTTIEEEAKHLMFRIKHFDPGLVGWEGKEESVSFNLVESTNTRAVFSRVHPPGKLWMVYEKIDQRTINTYFEKEPHVHKPEDEFHYSLGMLRGNPT